MKGLLRKYAMVPDFPKKLAFGDPGEWLGLAQSLVVLERKE